MMVWIHAILDEFASWTLQEWAVSLITAGGLGLLLGWANGRWKRL
jgi:hypothetical protein